jgi:hypothetical protein
VRSPVTALSVRLTLFGTGEEADRLASVAVSANDRRFEPYAIKEALRRLAGNRGGDELMAELAAPPLVSGIYVIRPKRAKRRREESRRCAHECARHSFEDDVRVQP